MKTYISGQIGTHTEAEKVKFERAENYLKEKNHDPVNPLKINCHTLASWPVRLEILSGCDAIYLLSDWYESEEASLEKYYCTLTGKEILFESRILAEKQHNCLAKLAVVNIESAIHEVTGLKLSDYQEGSRKVNGYFARMIFSKQCHKAGIDSKEIIHYIPGRDRTTILRYLKKYDDEFKFNPTFRILAEKVNNKLLSQKLE